MPYFERPKQPRDWRFWVGLVGRTFIVTGLLMFAFVAYQLWGTAIQTAAAQDDLRGQFDQALQSTSSVTTTTIVTGSTETTEPGATTSTSTIPVAAPSQIQQGDPIALLRIPKIGVDNAVVEGVGLGDLKKGPGHFPETPMPGQLGNAAIAGHRTTYGQPFYRLDELGAGDRIEVDTRFGSFVYEVTDTFVVEPSEYSKVIPTTDQTVATLTLATCTPRYTANQRLIVTATLVVAESSPALRPPSATVPTADTTTVPPTLPGDVTTLPPTDGTAATTTAAVAPPATTTPVEQSDAFSEGWFHDTSAILPSILWGLGLAAVAIGSWFVGKKAKRLWVCWLVGAIPFVVVLYFFFENVNRLLPPGI